MISEKFRSWFLVRVVLVTALTVATVLLIIFHQYYYLFIAMPVLTWLWWKMYQYEMQAHEEVEHFNESVRYHDFSRHFNESSAGEWTDMRKSFNEVFSVIKGISREKEKHYQYLHNILELVDTGIISYETKSHEIVWINESLKKLLRVPHLKTLESLARRHPQLYQEMLGTDAGKQSIATVSIDGSMFKILLAASLFEIDGHVYKVIAVQNVQEAMDETEARAWQKLLSVLTHEIMNSVAPISSVAKTLNDLMVENELDENKTLPVDDIRTGLDTIKRRSEGLLRFSETYRNLSKITSLNIQTIRVRELFNGLLLLMKPGMQQKKITLQTHLDAEDLELSADPNLIEQVLINLMMNAAEAVKDMPEAKIQLNAKREGTDRLQLSVSDNGTGIAPGLMDNIFIPFFSTRKNGTGIGLSLCKQIMLLHKGSIQVKSIEGTGSNFILHFAAESH